MTNCTCIIFSKDRPAQLDLLLQSILKYASQLWPPTIVYKHSNAAFGQGYRVLRDTYENCSWLWQINNFKQALMDGWRRDRPLTMFLVDDDVFFKPFDFPEHLEYSMKPDYAYMPRLGPNLTHCWNVDKPQAEGTLDYDCTCSLDGAIYRTDALYHRFAQLQFSNPNELEHRFCEGPQFKLMYDQQVLVGIPHNRVQDQYANRNMGGNAAELNERFLRGERIDLAAMDFSGVRGVHWPVEFAWRKAE